MPKSNEELYIQMVMSELEELARTSKPIRVSFAPGTDTHRQLSVLAGSNGVSERQIVEAAVRVFFVAHMRSQNV